jgi:hypothetical protein
MAGNGGRVATWPLIAVWGLTAAAHGAKAAWTATATPLILDGDDAMRLTEVHDLLDGQSWFDLVQHRLNAPFGAELHWSRLVDLPEALLLLLLRPFAGAAADTVAAYVWPALLLFLLLWATARLALKLGGSGALWPALLLTPVSLVSLGEFVPGRFDHHSLQILLALALLYCTVAALERPRFALGAGVAAAAALSIGIESLPVVAAAIVAFGCMWVGDARHSPAMRDFGLSFAAATALGLAVDVAPAEWLLVRVDQISIVYVGAAVLCALGFLLLSRLPLAGLVPRLAAATIAGLAAVGVLFLIDPAMLGGPYAALDPWLTRNWLAHVAEAQSWLQSFREDPVYPLAVTVPVLVALGWALANAARDRDRGAWLIVAVYLALGILVMLVQIRAARLVTPLAVAADAALVAAMWRHLVEQPRLRAALALACTAFGSAGLVVAVVVAAIVPLSGDASSPGAGGRAACLRPQAFTTLAALPPARVMAPIDLGSHILLFTPHSVVAAPYHRDQQGLLDALHFFDGPIGAARGILAARSIGLVVVCPAMAEFSGVVAAAPDSFAGLFAKGELPAWLAPVPASGPLRHYRVTDR